MKRLRGSDRETSSCRVDDLGTASTRMLLLFMMLYQLTMWIAPVVRGWDVCDSTGGLDPRVGIRETHLRLAHVVTNLLATIVFVMAWIFIVFYNGEHDNAALALRSKHVVLAGWLFLIIYCSETTANWCWPGWTGDLIAACVMPLSFASETLVRFTFVRGVRKRVRVSELAYGDPEVIFGEPIPSEVIRRSRNIVAYVGALVTVISLFPILYYYVWHDGADYKKFTWLCDCMYTVFELCASIGQFVTATASVRVFTQLIAATDVGQEIPSAYAKAETEWAAKLLSQLRTATALPCLLDACCSMGLVVITALVVYKEQDWELEAIHYAIVFAQGVPVIVECLCCFFVVGIFTPLIPSINIETPKKPLQSKRLSQSGDVWNDKVQELATRSIDVNNILSFFEALPEKMPHYSSEKSTTNDVVRAAIIPMTSRCSKAYSVMMCSTQVLPDRMVTHAWDNIFLHLVAAVVADALNLDSYGAVAQQLAEDEDGVSKLKERLRELGTLHKTYWICVFCVNQHASICGKLADEPPLEDPQHERWESMCCDTVTGRKFEICNCGHETYFNHSPECEMNKFDDVMAYLKDEARGIRQLVAADKAFAFLTRAWCVAELVQAFCDQIPQVMCVHSNDEFLNDVDTYSRIVNSTVHDCQASRPEDREFILNKIESKVDFDCQLQAVIFGSRGLFNRKFQGFGIMEAAVQVARRASFAIQTEDLQRQDSCSSLGSPKVKKPGSSYSLTPAICRTSSGLSEIRMSRRNSRSSFSILPASSEDEEE